MIPPQVIIFFLEAILNGKLSLSELPTWQIKTDINSLDEISKIANDRELLICKKLLVLLKQLCNIKQKLNIEMEKNILKKINLIIQYCLRFI